MMPKVTIFVENIPNNWERALSFVTNVDNTDGTYEVWLTRDRALLALALIANVIGAEVTYEGERIEVDL